MLQPTCHHLHPLVGCDAWRLSYIYILFGVMAQINVFIEYGSMHCTYERVRAQNFTHVMYQYIGLGDTGVFYCVSTGVCSLPCVLGFCCLIFE